MNCSSRLAAVLEAPFDELVALFGFLDFVLNLSACHEDELRTDHSLLGTEHPRSIEHGLGAQA